MLMGAVTSHTQTLFTEAVPHCAEACSILSLHQRQALAGAQHQG